MVDARAPASVWRSVRALPDFARLLAVRIASQFGDGLFQSGLAGALLFSLERTAGPWEIAAYFAVFYLPYSLIGPFAGALLDRWDRRYVLVGANAIRLFMVAAVGGLLLLGVADFPILAGALLVNGVTRFVTSGLSAALPHVVPREQVVTMNSLATAIGAAAAMAGAMFMLLPRWLFGAGDTGGATIIFIVIAPVLVALMLSLRFPARSLGPDDTARAIHGSVFYAVTTGLMHGLRTVIATPSVGATLTALAAHRLVFGINILLFLVIVRHTDSKAVGGLGTSIVFLGITGAGAFLAILVTPAVMRRFGRFASVNGGLVAAAVVQVIGSALTVPIMMACAFLLGGLGQFIKLCADSAMQLDVDDPLRGHVFAVQDALFWVSFLSALTVAAALVPAHGHSPPLALAGVAVYLAGVALHTVLGRRGRKRADG